MKTERTSRAGDGPSLSSDSRRLWRWMGLARRNQPGRYTLLLFTILLMIVLQPLVSTHKLAQAIMSTSMSLMLLSALYTLNVSQTYFRLGISLMVPAFTLRWVLQFHRSLQLEALTSVAAAAFLLATVVGLIRQLFSVRRVTLDTISAALCAYFLLAIAWGFMFAFVEIRHPGSFSAELFVDHGAGGPTMIAALHSFIYYSFVCLTTTGYGDIAPKSEIARTLSVLESVIGQMYLAILVARLVSLEVAQSIAER